MKHKITKVVVTTVDGVEHTYEGVGVANVRTSTTPDTVIEKKQHPSARLEINVPLEAEWAAGDGGRYVSPIRSSLR